MDDTHREFVDAVQRNFPEFADKLPGPEVKGGELPPKDQIFKFNVDETNKILGIDWIKVDESVIDLVKSLKELGI